jgi:hypothetical protein
MGRAEVNRQPKGSVAGRRKHPIRQEFVPRLGRHQGSTTVNIESRVLDVLVGADRSNDSHSLFTWQPLLARYWHGEHHR